MKIKGRYNKLMALCLLGVAVSFGGDLEAYNLVEEWVTPILNPGEILSPFHEDRGGYLHQGLDIRIGEGTPIRAVQEGIITKAAPDSKGVDKGGGHMVFLKLNESTEVRYMHLSGYEVDEGDYVKKGQVIGYTGKSGDTTTPHLHIEYRIHNEPIDPTFLFEEKAFIIEDIGQEQEKIDIEVKKDYFELIFNEPFFVIQR